ncbi:hypothetical protein B0A48_18428 [Cryoendolithus antarcticus]|uniref:Uncharacterized protein n=1 Tax=Cryoendolithus antarcticus TaxID=1507870 RepID=A0A1V8S8N5_9PEZI|nr:hypothetical protein B0A48_18428 [Cryoendolithus antarcticus]
MWLDFGEYNPSIEGLAFSGMQFDNVTGEVTCAITDYCSFACTECAYQPRKRPFGIRNTTHAYDPEQKDRTLHQYQEPASWQRLKLLEVALPVRVVIRSVSRGRLFSPQRDPSLPWDSDRIRMEIVLIPWQVTFGNLFAFWEKIMDEHIRVNSDPYAPACRAMWRKWMGPGETYLDDQEWDYAINMRRNRVRRIAQQSAAHRRSWTWITPSAAADAGSDRKLAASPR